MQSKIATSSSLVTTCLESVCNVADDLVSDRKIWRKIVCIVLFPVYLFSAWSVVALHVIHFSNETALEVTVSVAVLLVGQYLITGIVDGYIYYRRWSKASMRHRTKAQEENKEAWVCMRITLCLLGLAPIQRYIESLIIVRRMVALERKYKSEAVALAKESGQNSNLPSGSLISAPAMSARQSTLSKSTLATTMTPSRIRALDAGLAKVRRTRRQFRRAEEDAAYVALASGVAGVGPYVISQGFLYFRRVGLNYSMASSTVSGALICSIFGIIWLSAALTHFYPAAYEQSELEFERGAGQVPVVGLILLFSVHVIHVTLRCLTFMMFTGQFYWLVLVIVGFQLLLVFLSLIIARAKTEPAYNDPIAVKKASIRSNLLSDCMFSFVGLFEFANANAKYTRTRYFVYYFFYYLENSVMIGVWFAYFTYPGVWYYLPALLVVVVVQILGFILLQIYLYLFSKARRKRTLCGLCFAHKEPTTQVHFPPANVASEWDVSSERFMPVQDPSILGTPVSVLSGRSKANEPWQKRTASGICDPVFGEQIAQSAVSTNLRMASKHKRGRPHTGGGSQTALSGTNSLIRANTQSSLGRPVSTNQPYRVSSQPERIDTLRRTPKYSAYQSERFLDQTELNAYPSEIKPQHLPHSSSGYLPISVKDDLEQEPIQLNTRPPRYPSQHGRNAGRVNSYLNGEPLNKSSDSNPHSSRSHKSRSPYSDGTRTPNLPPQPGVFQPRPDQNRAHNRWPYAPAIRRT
ncbi:unnamed protein product [Calicophoron daubneyi]|uniref:XK-related protein n=1 Tax=Calicophoron daubneyi TaxID=300641 RepID=A0AAV2TXB8_CALDB